MKICLMIDSNRFIDTVKKYFSFLTVEFDFRVLIEKVHGNVFYEIQFGNQTMVISISYENIEDYLLVNVFILKNGKIPDYDDKTQTLHLNHLNKIIMPKVEDVEFMENNKIFSIFFTQSNVEKKLLKSARDLRLCLKHFNEIGKL